MLMMNCLLPMVLLAQAPEPAAPGRRADLGGAVLFVPDTFRPRGDEVDVLLHLHGAPTVIEPAFIEAKRPGVLIEFNRKGLSRVYAEPFSDRALFPRLLDAAMQQTRRMGLTEHPKAGKVAVSSFSAGFGGVRELLKVDDHFARIDELIMADSLYAGYEGKPAQRQIDPKLMEGFRRFALEAAAGRKEFLLTHSAQVPQGYASTTETADFLIHAVEGTARKVDVRWDDDWVQTGEFRKGNLVVLGFAGTDGAAHMAHLRKIAGLWSGSPRDARSQ